jgi:hypothetical protein
METEAISRTQQLHCRPSCVKHSFSYSWRSRKELERSSLQVHARCILLVTVLQLSSEERDKSGGGGGAERGMHNSATLASWCSTNRECYLSALAFDLHCRRLHGNFSRQRSEHVVPLHAHTSTLSNKLFVHSALLAEEFFKRLFLFERCWQKFAALSDDGDYGTGDSRCLWSIMQGPAFVPYDVLAVKFRIISCCIYYFAIHPNVFVISFYLQSAFSKLCKNMYTCIQ